ncbi:hypothetical protein BC749_102437 [Flavobacterium araucananum]|jgi:hypothetical protein|uniref:Uncharacterized protein n=1 Tax=Flavobacterium araucananum TaxID=946678 RepID=A0A227PB80_9FLAO|nr:hypothetical protein [Flavobacterium araucananum]OXG06528.1 hypothetical protein B0A64_10475 [Flavobacterium araucananum]PWK00870.1 hypothetical protein BC749_102437 [Flavobacterium araucananum]
MNWIRKAVIFVSLLIIAFFATQANESVVQRDETQKTDSNFSIDHADSLAFIQPQANYQFAANIKTNPSNLVKWFDALLMVIPQHKAVKSTSNFANQFATQSKKVLLMLYPFHFFW